MAHSSPIEQQNAEMGEGMLDWKLERYLEIKKEHKSPTFKFGRHNAFLRIPVRSSEYFTSTADHSKDKYPVFEVELNIAELLGINVFSNTTFYKMCFLASGGCEKIIKDGFILREETVFRVMLHRCGSRNLDELKAELLPQGTLTIRFTWYELRNRIRPMRKEEETQTPTDLIPEKEPTKLLLKLSEDLKRLFENEMNTDCVLRVGNVQIPAHRTVLSARSEVFAAMFRHDTSENRSGVVDIPDVDKIVLGDVLYYIYSGQIRGLTSDTAAPMFVVTDKYAVIELRDACLDLLRSNLTVENVCDAALLAYTHGETDLEEKVVAFVEDRLEEIEESDKWKEFLNEKPLFANKLMRSVVTVCKKKMRILTS